MTRFTASDGTEYAIEVSVLTISRVQKATGLRLTDLFGSSAAIAKFFADDVTFCEVLAAVVQPQLAAAGKTTDDFLATMVGSTVEAAAEALLREVANFSQEPRRGLLLKLVDKLWAEKTRVQEAETDALQKAIEDLDVLSMLTNSASSSPESSESTPGVTPSGS